MSERQVNPSFKVYAVRKGDRWAIWIGGSIAWASNPRMAIVSENIASSILKLAGPGAEVVEFTVVPNNDITLVKADDWQGIYVKDKLFREGHGFRFDEGLEALGAPIESFFTDSEWLADRGSLPNNLSEVPRT